MLAAWNGAKGHERPHHERTELRIAPVGAEVRRGRHDVVGSKTRIDREGPAELTRKSAEASAICAGHLRDDQSRPDRSDAAA
jgi:hypothetical protein